LIESIGLDERAWFVETAARLEEMVRRDDRAW
jgi:hypothetical protein